MLISQKDKVSEEGWGDGVSRRGESVGSRVSHTKEMNSASLMYSSVTNEQYNDNS